MDNILSYLKWRGDLDFSEHPFNEIDNLIFCQLAYLDLKGIIPDSESGGSICLSDAVSNYISSESRRPCTMLGIPSDFYPLLMNSKRIANLRLSKFKDVCDTEKHMQFAAFHIILHDGTAFIVFRGTDDTITGWREDFMMSFCITPAQTEAVNYLERTMEEGVEYRIGGHSKGGNLAVYASMMCQEQLQNQIIEIFDNDGPGLSRELIQPEKYIRIKERICKIIPEFSIIGTLFEQEGNRCKIVKSSEKGIRQHDLMSWEAGRCHCIYSKERNPKCKAINEVINNWIENVDINEKKVFTDSLFDALEGGGLVYLNDVAAGGLDKFESILFELVTSEKESKNVVKKLVNSLWKKGREIKFTEVIRDFAAIRGFLLVLLGLLFIEIPEHAMQVIGSMIIFSFLVFACYRSVIKLRKYGWRINKIQYRAMYTIVILALTVFLMVKSEILIISGNIILGILCLGYGFYRMQKAVNYRRNRKMTLRFGEIEAFIYLLFGLVAFAVTNRVIGSYIFAVGTFMALSGIKEVLAVIYKLSDNKI